jgi:CDP-6-deoxy-D-xylo-4-hexulose-3-dehydrase
LYPLATTTWDEKEIAVATKLLKSGKLTMGGEVQKFEKQFAQYIGTRYAVMFNSGSSANLAMFTALKYSQTSKIYSGDQVIVPAVSWSTTYYPVNQSGLILDFVDIHLDSLNINVCEIEKRINSRTKVIFAVNLLGNPSNLIELSKLAKRYNLILLEDNCESLGASIGGKKTGSFGLMGSHSFFFSHHICTMEGGMVTTDSKNLMETLVSIRAHGWIRGLAKSNTIYKIPKDEWKNLYTFVLPGYNLRPIELSGAIGQIQLKKYPRFLKSRKSNASYFVGLFEGSSNYKIQKEFGESSWFGFSLILQNKLFNKRDKLVKFLTKNKVDTRPIVAGNFTLNPVMAHLNYKKLPKLKNSDIVHTQGLFIGNHHDDKRKDLKKVYDLLMQFERMSTK